MPDKENTFKNLPVDVAQKIVDEASKEDEKLFESIKGKSLPDQIAKLRWHYIKLYMKSEADKHRLNEVIQRQAASQK